MPTFHSLVELAANVCPAAPQGYAVGPGLREVSALHSEAERRLYAAMTRAGMIAQLKPTVEGYELDLAIEGPGGRFEIEVDGVHHTDARGRQRRQDLARDAVLARLGWQVIRAPAWRCLTDPDAAALTVIESISMAPALTRNPSQMIENRISG